MQITPPNTLPIVSGLPQATPQRQPRPAPLPPQEAQLLLPAAEVGTHQQSRQAPLFTQTLAEQNLPHRNQQALRTYRDVAAGGAEAELVGRLDVTV